MHGVTWITEQQQKKEKAVYASSGHLNEGLDVPVAVGTHNIVLVEAHTSRMDDLCITRTVALVTLSPPSLSAAVTR